MAGRGGAGATGGAGSTGGSVSAGGSGAEPSSGGSAGRGGAGVGGDLAVGGTGGSVSATGGTGGPGGAGGEAEVPLENPAECVAVPSTRTACEGCGRIDAAAMRCPSPLADIEVAGSNLLVEHALGSSLLKGTNLFGFENEGRFVTENWPDVGVRRELAAQGEAPIVVHDAGDGVILVRPNGDAERTLELALGRLLDVGFDADTLRLLGLEGSVLTLYSVATDGSFTSELVSDDASAGTLVRGSSPPRVVAVDGAGDEVFVFGSGDPQNVALPSPIRVGTPWFSAIALGERLLLGSLSSGTPGINGTYAVDDGGITRVFGGARALSCPASYVAEYPDICEFEYILPVTTPGALLAAELVVHGGEPWLVSIAGDVTDSCRTSVGRCFESLPCDCEYRRSGSTKNAVLKVEHLDDPSRELSVELGDFPYETVQVAAASSESGPLFVAVAEGQFTPGGSQHAGALIDYLLLTTPLPAP